MFNFGPKDRCGGPSGRRLPGTIQPNRGAQPVSSPTSHRGPLKTPKRPAQKRPPSCTAVQRELGLQITDPTRVCLHLISVCPLTSTGGSGAPDPAGRRPRFPGMPGPQRGVRLSSGAACSQRCPLKRSGACGHGAPRSHGGCPTVSEP